MRNYLIAAAALAAAPALAQQQPVSSQPPAPQATAPAPVDPRDEEIRRNLPDPGQLKAMGEVAARAAEAMLDVPVGPLREAIEGKKLSRREREETLGDHAAKNDPQFRERMRGQMTGAGAALGALAEQMAVIGPALRRTMEDPALRRALEDAGRKMEEAMRGMPPRNEGENVKRP